MQLDTNAARLAGRAALEKYFDQVQPPREMFTLRSGVLRLELLELVEVAGQRLVERVGDAIDRVGGGEPGLVVGPGVTLAELVGHEAPALLVDVAEGVVDVGQLRGHAAGVDVLHLEVAGVDAPLGEVADLTVRSAGGLVGRDRDLVARRGQVPGPVAGAHRVRVGGVRGETAVRVRIRGGLGRRVVAPLR